MTERIKMSELEEAAELLDSPLIWSADMDSIRWHLAVILRKIAKGDDPTEAAENLCEALLDEYHNDISLG